MNSTKNVAPAAPKTHSDSATSAAEAATAQPAMNAARLIRTAVGGVFMGTANLIPGVSGGTMILAMGLYEEFIGSVAEISALRISFRRIVFLLVLGAFAAGAIVGLAGVILWLLFHYTSAMFALFIGLTLGGAPLLGRSLRPVRADAVISVVVGFALMAGVVFLKKGSGLPQNTAMDFVSGLVGSTTMVLPGISGSYMLLVMDQYDRVIGSIDDLKEGLRTGDNARLVSAIWIVVPVGIGAILGIVGLSNALKFLLRRYRRPTLGVLLGILLGSVLGLYPFGRVPGEKALQHREFAELREYVQDWQIPGAAEVSDEDLAAYILTNWDKRGRASHSAADAGIALVLAVGGFAATYLLSKREKEPGKAAVE